MLCRFLNTYCRYGLIVFGLVALSLYTKGCATAESSFKQAQSIDTVESYTFFLEKSEKSSYRHQARLRLEELSWQAAIKTNTIEAYEKFLKRHALRPSYKDRANEQLAQFYWSEVQSSSDIEKLKTFLGRFDDTSIAREALKRLDELMWLKASMDGTALSFGRYLARFPTGLHADEARKYGDDPFWSYSERQGTKDVYEFYLIYFPEGKHIDEANNRISEILWQSAVKMKTNAKLFKAYMEKYPDGHHAAEADDYVAWAVAEMIGSPEAVSSYIINYPHGHFTTRAKEVFQLIKEPAPVNINELVWDLINVKNATLMNFVRSSSSSPSSVKYSVLSEKGIYDIPYQFYWDSSDKIHIQIDDGSWYKYGSKTYVHKNGKWLRNFKRYFTTDLSPSSSEQ